MEFDKVNLDRIRCCVKSTHLYSVYTCTYTLQIDIDEPEEDTWDSDRMYRDLR